MSENDDTEPNVPETSKNPITEAGKAISEQLIPVSQVKSKIAEMVQSHLVEIKEQFAKEMVDAMANLKKPDDRVSSSLKKYVDHFAEGPDRKPLTEGREEESPKSASPNSRGPTLALSFRLKRGVAKRVEDVCRLLDWTRTEFFRTAIEGLLAEKEKMIKEKMETNEVKGEKPPWALHPEYTVEEISKAIPDLV